MNYTIAEIYQTKAGISVNFLTENEDDEKIHLLFKPSFWKKENLEKGDVLDEESFNALCETAELCCALARAESMLASSDYSRHRLVSRLAHYGVSKEICEKCADYMIEHGYINEPEQVARITKFFCIKKHWGKRRIAAELMGRGYDRKVIFAAISNVSDEEYHQTLLKLISEKYPCPADNKHENDLRIAALSRMGFSVEEIIRGLNEAEETYNAMEEELANELD